MGFKDYESALQMRRLIEDVSAGVVERLRPRPRYGTVGSIDSANFKCTITLIGDPDDPIIVNTGSLIPSHVGQRVQIGGVGNDRYVIALFGSEGNTVHGASSGPFVKLARVFTGVRKEVILDGTTADQLKVQFANDGSNTNVWVFGSDGVAYYNTNVAANQIQLGPPPAPEAHVVDVSDQFTRTTNSPVVDPYWTARLIGGSVLFLTFACYGGWSGGDWASLQILDFPSGLLPVNKATANFPYHSNVTVEVRAAGGVWLTSSSGGLASGTYYPQLTWAV